MMFSEIKFSFFFSFSLRNGDTSERHQSVGDQDQDRDHISLPIVSQRTVEPGAMIKEPVAANAPVRPVLSRLARYFRAESATQGGKGSETDDTHIADTHLGKANDRESLEILLRLSTQHEQPTRAEAFSTDTADGLSDSSLARNSPAASTTMLPQGPFVVRQSPVLEDDSGSDLVSSLQRVRIGGLASYFEELERRAYAHTLASTAAHVNVDRCSNAGLEADQYPRAFDVAERKWSEITVREASDEE